VSKEICACMRMGGLIRTQHVCICIHAGCCSVSVRGRQVAILEAGECIGEIALLSAEPHTAEVLFFGVFVWVGNA